MSIGKIWGLTMQADRRAEDYIDSVLSTWKGPFQESLELYKEAVRALSIRWGFGEDIGAMMRFIFDSNFCNEVFFRIDTGESNYYSAVANGKSLSDIEDDCEAEARLGYGQMLHWKCAKAEIL